MHYYSTKVLLLSKLNDISFVEFIPCYSYVYIHYYPLKMAHFLLCLCGATPYA